MQKKYAFCDFVSFTTNDNFKENAPDDQILGYVTAPWVETWPTEHSKVQFEKTFKWFKEAKEKIYG